MTNHNPAIVGSTNHEPPSTVHFVLDKLECVGSLIADVNQLLALSQRIDTSQPQQTLTRFTFAFLSNGFVIGNSRPMMQYLIAQPQHLPCLGIHRQAVLSYVASAISVADLSEIVLQRTMIREIQLRCIMKNQHRPFGMINLFPSCFAMWGKDRFVRNLLAIHPIEASNADRKQASKFSISDSSPRTTNANFRKLPHLPPTKT
jgi:hypothetical protein